MGLKSHRFDNNTRSRKLKLTAIFSNISFSGPLPKKLVCLLFFSLRISYESKSVKTSKF
jgi:hypothetical protein